ncbi:MAG: VanZ family protein [Verrucomicrobiota bacterium]
MKIRTGTLSIACGVGLLVWVVTLWFLSSRPSGGGPDLWWPHFDKVLHFGYFFIGGGLVGGCFTRVSSGWRAIFIATLVLAAVGALDEWHQLHTAGRNGADVWDWLADLCGAFAGILAGLGLRKRMRMKATE